jgi:hypothetical protein
MQSYQRTVRPLLRVLPPESAEETEETFRRIITAKYLKPMEMTGNHSPMYNISYAGSLAEARAKAQSRLEAARRAALLLNPANGNTPLPKLRDILLDSHMGRERRDAIQELAIYASLLAKESADSGIRELQSNGLLEMLDHEPMSIVGKASADISDHIRAIGLRGYRFKNKEELIELAVGKADAWLVGRAVEGSANRIIFAYAVDKPVDSVEKTVEYLLRTGSD